jgi:hypothetical protein
MDESRSPTHPSDPAGAAGIQLSLTADELELVRAALDYLRQTLGREEAEELDAVQRLLHRLPPADG